MRGFELDKRSMEGKMNPDRMAQVQQVSLLPPGTLFISGYLLAEIIPSAQTFLHWEPEFHRSENTIILVDFFSLKNKIMHYTM